MDSENDIKADQLSKSSSELSNSIVKESEESDRSEGSEHEGSEHEESEHEESEESEGVVDKGEPSEDPQFFYHQSQLNRLNVLIDKTESILQHNDRMAQLFWYISHLTALMGWIAGLSLVTTSITDTTVSTFLGIVIGTASTLYPFTKAF